MAFLRHHQIHKRCDLPRLDLQNIHSIQLLLHQGKNFLENNIENISGGELQRVAIAATVLKKANLYIFDELTSYLDIKQRLN